MSALLADLVRTSRTVRSTSARLEKRDALAGYLRSLAGNDLALAASYLAGEIPQGRLGMGWRSVDRAASKEPLDRSGQLALFSTDPSPGPLTLIEVDRTLAAIQAMRGKGAGTRRTAHLRELLERAGPEERSFLERLVLGELRQGALRALVLEAVALAFDVPVEDLRRAVMFAGGIREPVEALARDGPTALARVRLRPLVPVEPMLASPTPADLDTLFQKTSPWAAEWKLDGVRVQAHREGKTIRVYTRRLRDITRNVPEVVEVVRSLPARSLVLDGEVVAFRDREPVPFQDLMSLVTRESGRNADRPPLAVVFFDLLFRDGKGLVDAPYRERRESLAALVPEPQLMTLTWVRSAREAKVVQDAALAARHEGILLKNPDSPYAAGRRGSHWIKVKPAETLDLVILAAEWGSGRRRGWLSNLHLGARDARDPERFWMLGKTFKGLTDAMLQELTETLPKIETHRDAYTVFVRPELVVEIAFDGLQRSQRYDSALALRFARVKRFRPDKDVTQATTVDEVRALAGGL